MKALENVSGWKIYMRDKAKDIPIRDKVQVKKVQVIFETWGSLCDAVRSIIEDGKEACKHRWKAPDVLFDFLGFPMLEAIEEASTPKLKLDEVKQSFVVSKKILDDLTQIKLEHISSWIERPYCAIVKIEFYVGKWKTVKKREIASEVLRAKIHFEQAKSQEIDLLTELDAKWHSVLGQN